MALNNFMNKSKNKLKGFSLLELLISIFIFTLIIVTSISVFAGVVLARQKNRVMQKNLEEGRTALETMAKNIRMSRKLTTNGTTDQIVMFNNSQDRCIAYFFDSTDKSLKTEQAAPDGSPSEDDYPDCSGVTVINDPIIPSDNITGSFDVVETNSDSSLGDIKIGKATIRLTIGSGDQAQNMQTTVSFRDYEGILY